MSRSSPGVRRVASILNFIADHPGQAFALTDLVRALKLSRATCHALLTGLVDVGYLYRTSDKTYVIGPTLAAIGRGAAQHFTPLQVAQPEMRTLADDFDVVCGAYFVEGDVIHLRERAASASHVGYPVPLGTRMPMRYIQAIPFYARSPKETEAWLARTDLKPEADQVAAMERGFAFVRDHGYIALVRKTGMDWTANFDATAREIVEEPPVEPLARIEKGQSYRLVALMAPIYEPRDKVSISLLMAGFPSSSTGAQIEEAGEALAAACQRISRFIVGGNGAAD
jgi:DNA-binding IclR family transcriptional regulator